jgi:hypothetical protein
MNIPDIGHVYEVLRKKNPWLPPADMVSGKPGMSLDLGIDRIPVLRLEVFIELPDMIVGDEQHSFGQPPEEEEPEVLPEKAPKDIHLEYKTDEVW